VQGLHWRLGVCMVLLLAWDELWGLCMSQCAGKACQLLRHHMQGSVLNVIFVIPASAVSAYASRYSRSFHSQRQ
jgi:hypothetical protein